MISIRKDACIKAGKILGISSFDFLGFPDMQLDTVSCLEINRILQELINKYNPDIVYTTSCNDLNKDHQKVYDSTLVVTRPISSKVKKVISYEVPGLFKNPFHPTLYENITNEISTKIKAAKLYKSEIEKFPHPRSIKSIENLAIQRGIESGCKRAEAFQLIRSIED